jgi:intein/homing endonuclease
MSFIRNIFQRDNQRAELGISSRELLRNAQFGNMGGALDILNTDLNGMLTIDKGMMSRQLDYARMDEYAEVSCLSGDSNVFTLHMGWQKIKDLAGLGGSFHVLSYDKDRKSLVPSYCDGARLTGKKGHGKRMVNVIIDNGQVVRATEDHLFMLKSGDYIPSGSLKVGQMLMPGRLRHVSPSSSGVSCGIIKRNMECHDLLSDGANHMVLRVEYLDYDEDVYDLSVPKYHNFVCNGIVVHNSALDIYADDATQKDSTTGKVLWVESDDNNIKDELTDLFENRVDIENNIWEITRNLCKTGNDYEELIIGGDNTGVVGINFLPTQSMRRIENNKGDLLGFIQTFSDNIDFTPEQFKKFQLKGGAGVNDTKDISAFEDWRVTHMRLVSKYRGSMYGWSVVDSARWIWKRLMLLEDAVLVYKLCLKGDSHIWTDDGVKNIRDLNKGDIVYSYGKDDELKQAKVIYKKHNGQDKIYRVSSKHRDLYANATHPVLTETVIGQGSGKPKIRYVGYVEVQNLKPGVHRLITPERKDFLSIPYKLKLPKMRKCSKMKKATSLNVGIRHLQDSCGVQSNLIKDFLDGKYILNTNAANRILLENGSSDYDMETWDDFGGRRRHNIPDYVTPDFARLFGFLLGDGFVSERESIKDGSKCFVREVGFAAGDKKDVNDKYRELLELFFGESSFSVGRRSVHSCVGRVSISSKPLYDFMIMNGFVTGAHSKRVPKWIFQSSYAIRSAFIDGFVDADGWRAQGGVSENRGRVSHDRCSIELCNKELVGDIRDLVMQMGLCVTRISCRTRSGGMQILNNGHVLSDRESYSISWSMNRQPMSEVVNSVELVDTDDIWDIGVDSEEHNFVADGVVVHNTRSPSRYAFYIDTGKAPRREAERIVQEAMHRLKKKKFIDPKSGKLNLRANPMSMDQDFFLAMRDGRESTRVESLAGPSYQQVDDVQYFLYKLYAALKVPRAYMGYDENQPSRATLCLAGDTKVPLLDGTEPTIAELSKRDDPFWVYSVDDQNNIVPGLARNARLTRRQAETVEVELDNGEVLTCTPDHPIMMRDGHYEEAGNLKAGDSVMPLYRRDSIGNMSGYEEVYDPGDDNWRFTHRMVTDSLFDGVGNGSVRHHVNFHKCDNRPENLKIMGIHEHIRLHARHAEKTLMRPDVVDKKIKAQKEWLKTDEGKAVIQKNLFNRGEGSKFQRVMRSEAYRKKHSDLMRARHSDPSDGINKYRSSDRYMDVCNEHSLRMTGEGNPRFISGTSFEELVNVARSYRCRSLVELSKWTGWGISVIYRVLSDTGVKYKDFADKYMASSKFRDSANRRWHNHKVVSVRPGPVIDTYDLTVDGYHNFAVQAGVIVHNSQEDVRFARTVLRVQREVVNGMRRIAKVNLAAKRIDPAAVKFDIRMTVPSSIFELGQMEALRTRAELASSMERHVSHHWLLKNIYRLSDDEIESIMMQKKKDAGGEGGAPGGMGFESVSGRIIRPQFGRITRPLTERDLFDGNPEDEKRIEKIVRRELERPDSYLGRSMRETGNLLRELAATIRSTSRSV